MPSTTSTPSYGATRNSSGRRGPRPPRAAAAAPALCPTETAAAPAHGSGGGGSCVSRASRAGSAASAGSGHLQPECTNHLCVFLMHLCSAVRPGRPRFRGTVRTIRFEASPETVQADVTILISGFVSSLRGGCSCRSEFGIVCQSVERRGILCARFSRRGGGGRVATRRVDVRAGWFRPPVPESEHLQRTRLRQCTTDCHVPARTYVAGGFVRTSCGWILQSDLVDFRGVSSVCGSWDGASGFLNECLRRKCPFVGGGLTHCSKCLLGDPESSFYFTLNTHHRRSLFESLVWPC